MRYERVDVVDSFMNVAHSRGGTKVVFNLVAFTVIRIFFKTVRIPTHGDMEPSTEN
jgi:hypothetical protein